MPVVVPDFIAFADVATTVPHFISFEVGNPFRMPRRIGSLAPRRHRAVIAALRIVVVVYMPAKFAMPAKPGAGTYEDTTGKPFRPVVAIRSAGIGVVVVVTIGALGSGADTDDNLRLYFGSGRYEARPSNCCQSKIVKFFHDFSAQPPRPGVTCPALVE